jgi:hypothetical protein
MLSDYQILADTISRVARGGADLIHRRASTTGEVHHRAEMVLVNTGNDEYILFELLF